MASEPGSAAIVSTAAADKTSDAAYPFIKDVVWASDCWSKPSRELILRRVTKGIGKKITMGTAIDRASLRRPRPRPS